MPVYEYTALNQSGKQQKGIIEAESQSSARQKIRGSGKFPVNIKETTPHAPGLKRNFNLGFSLNQRVKQQEIHIATRQLATLLGAGIPLVSAIGALIEQTTNQGLKKILAQIKDSVNEGNSLTSSLAKHPKLFSKIYINMIRAGEASGSLDIVLDRLAEFGESQQAMKSRVKAALMYPIFMAVVGTVVLFLLITFIVPSITQVFDEMQQALPLPTIFLITISNFLRTYWWFVILVVIAVGVFVKFFIDSDKGRIFWDRLQLRLPLIGSLNRRIAAARFGRTLGSLLHSGVPMIASLHIVKNILNNVILAEVIDEATEELEKGRSLSEVLRRSRWFSPMLVQMIAVGEQSGALEKMLDKVADSYEKEIESKILAMTSLIEPIMILVMGLAVSFIVISVLLPIFEMNQLVR